MVASPASDAFCAIAVQGMSTRAMTANRTSLMAVFLDVKVKVESVVPAGNPRLTSRLECMWIEPHLS